MQFYQLKIPGGGYLQKFCQEPARTKRVLQYLDLKKELQNYSMCIVWLDLDRHI